jgi:hypothetical protein
MPKGADALLLMAGPPKLGKGGSKPPKPGPMGDDESDDVESGAEARAGAAFGRAVKSGDGAEIARTYRALKEACEESTSGPEEDDGEEY